MTVLTLNLKYNLNSSTMTDAVRVGDVRDMPEHFRDKIDLLENILETGLQKLL